LHVKYTAKNREKQKQTPRIVTCKGCGKEFDSSSNGRLWRCPECILKYQQEYAKKDRERHAEYSRKYREKQGEAYRQKMQRRRGEMLAQMTPAQQEEFRQKERDKSARLFAALREQVFSAYGGKKCACCGEDNPLFLTIDHINNDGADMRNNGVHGRSGTAFYQWLRKSGFPSGFQVLCYNCNLGKHRNGGVCPHKSSKV
jgi:predicted  nucleic acid-binding Zn-ribbon protein